MELFFVIQTRGIFHVFFHGMFYSLSIFFINFWKPKMYHHNQQGWQKNKTMKYSVIWYTMNKLLFFKYLCCNLHVCYFLIGQQRALCGK